MGEAAISGGSRMEPSENKEKALIGAAAAPTASTSSSVVMWERFLPKMVVRVLLVEADDSTRQIIAALLRKCSYRVAAVGDGLKAWEVLRERPCNIDLILTEVDLPLISGYALLTLIMEHEVCKNIPVIMMSSHDSVATVYKCMLRGATDFLVKPVRKNELSNLWQHVWRKQASSNGAGLGPPDESIGQKKDEATAENNAASDSNSSRCVACARRSRECTEKGSEAQSSCTKPDSGNDGEGDEDVEHGFSEPKRSKRISECGSQGDGNSEKDKTLRDSSLEAIDLIKSFDNHHGVAVGSSASNICSKKFDDVPQLDLSLQRPRLNHSEASPFSRYINKPGSSTLMCNQPKDHETVPESRASNHYMACSSEDPTMASQKYISVTTVQTRNGEASFSYSPNREMARPVPVRGARYENAVVNGYDSLVSRTPCRPPDRQASCSLQVHCLLDQRNSGSVDHTDNKQSKNSDSLGNENLVSPWNNQSSNASFCNSNIINAAASDCGTEQHAQDGLLHRSMQREAALTKFRMKRKERCFEKKVRYESRKKLAEQRPRVKGQFVRQTLNDPQPGNNSSAA